MRIWRTALRAQVCRRAGRDVLSSGRVLRFGRAVHAYVHWQGGWLAGLLPPSAPAPAFREGVNVLFSGTEEIQKVPAHAFARADSKPILRVINTMLQDKDVYVRRLREGYEFFKSMAQRRTELAAARAATA